MESEEEEREERVKNGEREDGPGKSDIELSCVQIQRGAEICLRNTTRIAREVSI